MLHISFSSLISDKNVIFQLKHLIVHQYFMIVPFTIVNFCIYFVNKKVINGGSNNLQKK